MAHPFDPVAGCQHGDVLRDRGSGAIRPVMKTLNIKTLQSARGARLAQLGSDVHGVVHLAEQQGTAPLHFVFQRRPQDKYVAP